MPLVLTLQNGFELSLKTVIDQTYLLCPLGCKGFQKQLCFARITPGTMKPGVAKRSMNPFSLTVLSTAGLQTHASDVYCAPLSR